MIPSAIYDAIALEVDEALGFVPGAHVDRPAEPPG